MMEIKRIWFDEDFIYGEDKDSNVHRQSLLWYPNLRNASADARLKYEMGFDGIHWRNLDEDVSFESFGYDDAVPSVIQKFFLSHPEISVSGFAKRIGISGSTLRNYINGFAKPSKDWEETIINKIHALGLEMVNI